MKISREWLATMTELPASAAELERQLTAAGLEVEAVEDQAERLRGFVVGSVLACEKHPKADKLSICTVDDGAGHAQVICGAPNVAAGQKVIFARIGAVVPRDGFAIEKKKIWGVLSSGMICSASELELGEDKSGIMVLPAEAPVGMPAAEYLGRNDLLLEIGITPNRPDALSHAGVARDLAAINRAPLRLPEVPDLRPAGDPFVRIDAPRSCPRYAAAIIRGTRAAESPAWLRRRLEAVGLRAINAIVDVTNYVMVEMGQPMHAFDLRMLEGESIVVRESGEGERFVTLDGKERMLRAGSVLICDARKPVALGGVMGGANSEISGDTRDLLLESAYFDPASIRRTSKYLGLSTDSSYRFERGSDPNAPMHALARAAALIVEIAGGSVTQVADVYPVPVAPARVDLRTAQVPRILGIDIPVGRMREILAALGCGVEEAPGILRCTAPTFRPDLTREIDLIEEVARIHGYDEIPTPRTVHIHAGARIDAEAAAAHVRSVCLGFGLDETMSPSLIEKAKAELFAPGATVSVLNPVNAERPTLRPSIVPSLLESIDFNLRNGTRDLRIFEIGSVFRRAATPDAASKDPLAPFAERMMLGIALTGRASPRSWHTKERTYDFFDLKGIGEALLDSLHLDNHGFICYDSAGTLSKTGLRIEFQGRTTGFLEVVPDELLASFGVDQPVYVLEMELPETASGEASTGTYSAISKFPPVTRDCAFVLDGSYRAEEIIGHMKSLDAPFLREIQLVDIFEHPSLGEGRKSLAFTFTLQAPDHTLTDAEIQGSIGLLIGGIEERFHGQLRSS